MTTSSLITRCAMLLCLLLGPGLATAEPIVIRFSHVVAEDTPKGIGAQLFKQKVTERLGDRVRVEIYPKSQRFTDEQALLGLLFGDVEMAAPGFSKFRQFSSKLQVFDLPFLFQDVEQVHRFQRSDSGQALLLSMLDKGILGLAYWDNGMRVISSRKPILQPSDMKGLRVRIEPSVVLQNQYSRLGAIPIAMPFKHLRDALQDGVVDGYENAWSNVRSRNLQSLRTNFTSLGHSYLGYMVVVSNSFWEALEPEIRAELEKILGEVTDTVNQLAAQAADNDRQTVSQTQQVQVHTPDEAQLQAWKAAMRPVWDQFASDIGPELIAAAQASAHAPAAE